jgi:hypothetical protein
MLGMRACFEARGWRHQANLTRYPAAAPAVGRTTRSTFDPETRAARPFAVKVR